MRRARGNTGALRTSGPSTAHSAGALYGSGVEQELVVRDAAPGLRRYVRRYVGYAERSESPMRQREPAGPGVVLIFGLGPELKVLDPVDPKRPPARLGSFFGGPDDRCAVVEHDGEMRGVEVDLTPLAARMLFREPMHALARRTVALEDLLGTEARRLDERLIEASTWSERFELVEAALADRLLAAEPPPADVDWAWRRLTSGGGRVRIADLAAELGCSRKHLAARFREHVGLPPSRVARLLRFRRALELLSSPHATIAYVAHASRYYDQAHLDRDFRDFAATTPTAYVAELRAAVTSIQDAAVALP
jgi:AraC-like DNA-binding protein